MQQKGSPLIIFVAVLASLLEIIDTSIVNVALPTMMGNLGATLEDISMIITGYAIANAIVLPVSSWASEKLGRRKFYLGCIVGFTITSVACGLTPNLSTLIVFRILQGLFGGALLPTSQALIYEQFPKEKAGMAGAIFGMSVMIGPTLGPVLGGYLTDNFGWRSIFNVNLPLGVLAFVLGSAAIFDRKRTAAEGEKKDLGFDGIGLILLVLGIGCLQYVLERGESQEWYDSTAIRINTAISLFCLPAFIWWELKVKNPIINVRLFTERIVQSGVGLMIFLGFFLYAVVFLLPIFLGSVFHYTATQIGTFFIPGSILTAMMMPFIGKALSSIGPKILIFIGLLGVEACAYLMTGFSPLSSKNEILIMLFVRGFALAFLFVPINSSILSQFSGVNLGQVAGLLNLFRQIGGSVGVALVATLLSKNGFQNYLNLSERVSLLNPATQSAYYSSLSLSGHKFQTEIGLAPARDVALRAIKNRMMGQVFMLSFNQVVWTIIFIFALAFIPLYNLEIKRKIQVSSDHSH